MADKKYIEVKYNNLEVDQKVVCVLQIDSKMLA